MKLKDEIWIKKLLTKNYVIKQSKKTTIEDCLKKVGLINQSLKKSILEFVKNCDDNTFDIIMEMSPESTKVTTRQKLIKSLKGKNLKTFSLNDSLIQFLISHVSNCNFLIFAKGYDVVMMEYLLTEKFIILFQIDDDKYNIVKLNDTVLFNKNELQEDIKILFDKEKYYNKLLTYIPNVFTLTEILNELEKINYCKDDYKIILKKIHKNKIYCNTL